MREGFEYMSRDNGRSHAQLPRRKGDSGEPFLPKVGELYLVATFIYSTFDPAADRPVVVIMVPPGPESRFPIQFVTRTSKQAPGVPHPVDMQLGCDRDGVFSSLASAEQQLWTPQNVQRLGVLPDPYWSKVRERFS
ncbi:hypothetical protein GCM10027569_73450 [Flindersiella endophytica]